MGSERGETGGRLNHRDKEPQRKIWCDLVRFGAMWSYGTGNFGVLSGRRRTAGTGVEIPWNIRSRATAGTGVPASIRGGTPGAWVGQAQGFGNMSKNGGPVWGRKKWSVVSNQSSVIRVEQVPKVCLSGYTGYKACQH